MPFTYDELVRLVKSPEKLELELDAMHNGVDKHLNIIARELVDWRAMAPALNIKERQVLIIIQTHPHSPEQRGPELLRMWKGETLNATYAKLLQACADIGDAKTAKKIVEVLNETEVSLEKQAVPPKELDSFTELPKYDGDKQEELYKKYKPQRPPRINSAEHDALCKFSREVEIIIQTVNDNEYQAAVTFLKPPTDEFEKSVVFPSAGTVLGNFADHKIALIQTDVGSNAGEYIQDAIDNFPNAQFIIGVGVGYAFDRSKCKFGDVLVSKKVSDLRNWKFDKQGEVVDRGERVDVVNTLQAIFCRDATFEDDIQVALPNTPGGKPRNSKVHVGTFASFAVLMDNQEMRDKFGSKVPEVIGGEMEGGELLRFPKKKDNNIDGIIVIKGVVDYGDGKKDKRWQFTAAMAALTYTRDKLCFYQGRGTLKKAVAGEKVVAEEQKLQRGGAEKTAQSSKADKFPNYLGRSAPKMRDLSFVKNREGMKFRLLSQIAMHWKTVASILGFDVVTVDLIAKQHSDDVESQIVAVFKKWTENASDLPYSHHYPLSWYGLNEILVDSELNEVAKKYFHFLETC